MRKYLALLFILFAWPVLATTTVTGHIKDLSTNPVTSGTFVRFWLRGCAGNQPTVNGTAVIAPTSGGVYYFDFTPDGTGNISGTLYSTRDSTGNNGGDISCGGSTTSVWYGMQIWVNGKSGPEIPMHAKNGVTLDITNVTPISVTPVVTAPTGDNTYLRLDNTNGPAVNEAIKPAASDAYFIVSGNGSDTTGDGLSGGTAYATWAKAKTSCGSTPCVVTILETAASAGCPDTTATIVTFDYRYLATPCGNNTVSLNNPGNGSITSASLQRTSLFISSPTTSAAGGIFFGDYTGALPASQSNEGLNGTVTTSGTITSVGSGYHLIGVEGSVSTGSNGQTLPDVRGLTGNCNLASGTTNVTKCSSVYAQAPTNTGTGTLTNAISFYAEMPTAGGSLNQAGHFDGQVTVGGSPGSPRIWIDKNADGQIEGSIFTLLSSGGGTITHQAPNTASNFTITDPAATGNAVVDSATQTLTNKTLTSPVINTGVSGSAIEGTGTLLPSAGTLGASLPTCTDANKTLQTSGCPSTIIVVMESTSAQTVTGTTLTNATGFSFTANANTNYRVSCSLVTKAVTGGSVLLTWTGPASPGNVLFSSNPGGGPVATSLGSTLSVTNSTTDVVFGGSLDLQNGANSGTVQLQFANNTGGDGAVLERGSFCQVF